MDLKLGHYNKDGIEVIDVGGEIDISTAPRLRELLIDMVSKNNYQLIVNMDKVEFLDSTGLGVLVGGLKRVRAHDGSLDLVCTQERILKIFKITGLTSVFGIYQSCGPGHRGQEVRIAAGFALALRPRVTRTFITNPSNSALPCSTRRAGEDPLQHRQLPAERPRLRYQAEPDRQSGALAAAHPRRERGCGRLPGRPRGRMVAPGTGSTG